jgi:elongation factor 2
MKFSVSPVVRRAISPHNVADLAQFIKGVKKLINSDPGLELHQSATECVIAGTGELHIECAINDLKEFLGEGVGFNVSPPVVKFMETVLGTSSQVCLAKTTNKLNRFYVVAQPLVEKLVSDLEAKLLPQDNPKEFAQILCKDYEWDKSETGRLWWFEGTNCLVDMTRAVDYLPAVKDHLIAACQAVCTEGVLCGEPLRGVRFNIVDALLHSDNVHRSSGQVIPAAKRAFLAAQLCAQPALVEPMFLAEIQTDQKMVSKIYSLMFKKRSDIFEEVAIDGTPLTVLRAHIPVIESFGFDAQLREATSGYATPTLIFSHWSALPGPAFQEGTMAYVHSKSVRDRRGLRVPVLTDLVDKL